MVGIKTQIYFTSLQIYSNNQPTARLNTYIFITNIFILTTCNEYLLCFYIFVLKINSYKIMQEYENININDYDYELPKEFIAQYPLEQRDKSRLLIYRNKNIKEDIFKNIDKYIPENSYLIFNDTKVIKSRLFFLKPTGAQIEIFCLEPEKGMAFFNEAISSTAKTTWKCLVGKSGKWKRNILERTIVKNNTNYKLIAKVIDKAPQYFTIEFSWFPEETKFSEILKLFGETPLPPYIKRKAIEQDELTYQTIYAQKNGSVAAPTSGFHFTEEVFTSLRKKDINFLYITLHIGIGTFKPVKSESIINHKMHSEFVSFEKDIIEKLYTNIGKYDIDKKKIISVGTTSTRALETLYYLGKQIYDNRELRSSDYLLSFNISQWMPYKVEQNISIEKSLEVILEVMQKESINKISGETEIIIIPGFKYKFVDGLITNFHLPKSTLLLLVSAFIGDKWREIYKYALDNKFRFLSYGDACLFFRN